jgi:glycosyltransferase involved in cell wall biosynthesis
MRVLIYAPAARTGGARSHVLGLVPELAAIAPGDEFLLLAQPDLIAELPPLPPTWSLRSERAEQRGFVRRLIWEQRVLPRILQAWRADVLLSFGSFVPLRSSCPSVLEAGNALPFTRMYWQVLTRESTRLQVEERARWALLRASLQAAARVLVPSRAMRQDVVTRLPGLGPKIDVAIWGVAPVFHQVRWQDPAGKTILGVSRHAISKEFDVLVAALPYLLRAGHPVELVLTGRPEETRWSRRSLALAHQLGVANRVCFAGDVPNQDMPALMQRARAVVLPTWCESFGLPLAEALAMGAPAVGADIPACREVGADGARYYATGNAQSLAETLGQLLTFPAETERLRERALARGKEFRWRDNAAGVYASLVKVAA